MNYDFVIYPEDNGKRAEYDMEAMGKNLRRYRKGQHLTEQQVGDYLLVSPQAVHKWEHGKSFPSLDNFFALCELYEAKPEEVMVKKTRKFPVYVAIEKRESEEERLKRTYEFLKLYWERIKGLLYN